jgi:YD repeat-containing protein
LVLAAIHLSAVASAKADDPDLCSLPGPSQPRTKATFSRWVTAYAGVCARLRALQLFCRVKPDRGQDKNSGINPDRQILSRSVILFAHEVKDMRRIIFTFLPAAFLLASAAPSGFSANSEDHNPIGVTGAFEGMTTTGCAYNVLNHNARREVDDIVVPGSIGKYPLKMTRYYNSRRPIVSYGLMGPGWSHEYLWGAGLSVGKFYYPNGSEQDSHCFELLGVSDGWMPGSPTCDQNGCRGDFRLADGGTVHFDGPLGGLFQARTIKDPYNQTTTLTYYTSGAQSGLLYRVTEPGGRYLQFNYSQLNGYTMLHEVDAYDRQGGSRIDWVVYNYTSRSPGGQYGPPMNCLTSVDYSDGQHAYYTYQDDNAPEHPGPPCPCVIKVMPLLRTCRDVRYKGAMRHICYDYQDNGPHGAIIAERYSLNGSTDGPRVSKIDPPAPSPLVQSPDFPTTFTESRGDGPTRSFTYTPLRLGRPNGGDPETCPIVTGPAPQQFLKSYTDFKTPGNSTQLGYDTNWYVNSVTDANGHTTSYTRGPPPPAGIGQITQIEHPDHKTINYDYTGANGGPWYVMKITDERGNITQHTRDNNHRITSTDHKDRNENIIAYEEFRYDNNPFGLLSTHHLPSNASANGAYVHFQYDGRGLLIAKTNPTTRSDWNDALANAPKTTYTYYTAADGKPGWVDRVQTMTLPANAQGLAASETYEYDLSANNTSRGLVTKITHNDATRTYKSFGYDVFGNKLWEENEKRNHTSYDYDNYNRVTKITDPFLKFETFSYLKPGANSSYLHTTSSVYTHTSRTNIVTTNTYDNNFRKKTTTVGSSITQFDYDNVGNLTDVTDPRGKITHNEYDNRNRKGKATEAYGTGLAATTVWHYDPASNIQQIDRPDSQYEWKGYDALNRMIWHWVQRQIPNTNPVESEDLVTGFGYWPSGKLLWVQDPNHWGVPGVATYFGYNESDQMNLMVYPGGTEYQQWSYDDAHNLASRTTVHGAPEIQRFTYDIRNRKVTMRWDNNADWADFTYDDVGRLLTATNPNSTITRAYDAAGRLTQDQQAVNGLGGAKNVTYPLYDYDGKLKRIYVAGAYDYTFGYDPTYGRFETITTGGSTAFKYEYDLASNVTHRYTYLPNSVTIDQFTPPDSLNRISGRWIYKNGNAFAAQIYTYDHMNRLGRVNWGSVFDWFGYYWDGELAASVYSVPQDGPEQLDAGQDPDLDTDGSADPWAGYQAPEVAEPEHTPPPPRGRPTPYPRPTPPPTPTPSPTPPPLPPVPSALVYVYDGTGNRLWMADDLNGGKDYVPNDLNQYTSITGSTISNGNEHEVSAYKGPTDATTVNYSYINDEHLKSVTAGGITYTLAYDALGRCVKRTLSANVTYPLSPTTYYIYDGEKPILEYNGANVARNVYGKGIDEILMRTDPTVNSGQPFYYGQDHEGSVTHLINASGTVIESYQYDAFGAVMG